MTGAPATYSVLVFDMAHTGHEDGEQVVSGFTTLAAARDYARRRTRASVEELRKPGIAAADLRKLWYIYGEDCTVPGDSYSGAAELDRFIAEPASKDDCDWTSIAPGAAATKRYYMTVLASDGAGTTGWLTDVARFPEKPNREALREHFREDVASLFARKGKPDAKLADLTVAHLFEWPDPPRPPQGDDRHLKRWHVKLGFVCHDVKFGADSDGVFAWPEEPSGAVLRDMQNLLMAETLSHRGDGPGYVEYSEITRCTVTETDAPLTHPPLP
jgi:hypothetical protein